MLHENIGLPHRKHVYQLMANELKIPHVGVSLIYMGGTGFGHIRLFLFREIWLLVFVGDNCIIEWHLCVVYEKIFSFAYSKGKIKMSLRL